jgi:glycerate 2-kinase
VPPAYRNKPGRIEVVEASHPVPDEAGQRAALRIVELVRELSADDLVLCLISGGGSALLTLPAAGLRLAEKQAINKALLDCGAAIDEMNCVRKHLSAIKGGRLGAMCAPAKVVTLLISDVPGDSPAVIASGPTVPDKTTCDDALGILARYRIHVPDAVHAGLRSGALETPKPGDPRFAGHEVHLIATPRQSLEAAAKLARAGGVEAHILSDEIEGESREVGKVHAALARSIARHDAPFAKPCVILSGGETTVTVKAAGGRGGRATEFLLGCAIALQGEPEVHVLAADTDGIDGIEENAGALVTPRAHST